MKKGKGLIALLLSVTLILTLFSGVAFAEGEDFQQPGDGLQPGQTQNPPVTEGDIPEEPEITPGEPESGNAGGIVQCTMSEDCTAKTHEEGCPKGAQEDAEDDSGIVQCTMSEDCTAKTHEEGCPKGAPEDAEDDSGDVPGNSQSDTRDTTSVPQNKSGISLLSADAVTTEDALNQAIEAIESSGTVTLGGDITVSNPIVISGGKTVTLDLNGNTLAYNTSNSPGFIQVKDTDTKLIIRDSSTAGNGSVETSNAYTLYIYTGASVELQSGSLVNTHTTKYVVYVASNAAFTMTGGEIHSAYRTWISNGGTTQFNGGKIYATGASSINSGFIDKENTILIREKDGAFAVKKPGEKPATYNVKYGTWYYDCYGTISNATAAWYNTYKDADGVARIEVNAAGSGTVPRTNLSSGTMEFTLNNGATISPNGNANIRLSQGAKVIVKGEGKIKEGTIVASGTLELVASVDDATGATTYEAKIPAYYRVGTQTFSDLQEAIAVAGDGTITLLRNATQTAAVTIPEDGEIVLDLGGYTLAISNEDTDDNDKKYTDADINSADEESGIFTPAILNHGTLTVQNGEIATEMLIDPVVNTGNLTIAADAKLSNSYPRYGGYSIVVNIGGSVESAGELESAANNVITTFGGTVSVTGGRLSTTARRASTLAIFNRGYDNESAGANVTVSGGELKSGSYAASVNAIRSGGSTPSTLTITGGSLTSYYSSIYWPGAGTLIIGAEGSANGPTITSTNGSALEVCSGTLNLFGGTLNGGTEMETGDPTTQDWPGAFRKNSGASNAGDAITLVSQRSDAYASTPLNINIQGGTFNSTQNYGVRYLDCNLADGVTQLAQDVSVSIEGGSFTGKLAAVDAAFVEEEDKAFISGGTYSNDVAEYILPGLKTEQNDDGDFTVEVRYVAEVDGQQYTTLAAAVAAAGRNGVGTEITLIDDVTGSELIPVNGGREITIDLNGHNIGFAERQHFQLVNCVLNLTGEGKIYEEEPYFGPVMMYGTGAVQADYTVVNVGSDVTLEGWSGLFIDNNGGNQHLNHGIVANVYGTLISVQDSTGAAGHALYVNGQHTYVGETVPKITLDGATLINEGGGNGMYLAGYAETEIRNSTITSSQDGSTGIEIRAGKLTISDSEVTGGSGEYEGAPNGNGSTSSNVALAVAQHTTKLPIEVTVEEGTVLTGGAAFVQSNPQKNEEEAISKVEAAIEGGTFTGQVYAENITGFISGGTFSEELETAYAAPGFEVIENQDGTFGVAKLQNVYVSGSGRDDNNGTDAANAVQTLERALELVAEDGTIYVCGTVTVDSSLTVDGAKIERADGFDGMLISVDGANAKLTLKNTTLDGKNETVAYGSYLVFITNGGTLNIESGTELINNKTTAAYVNVDSFLNMNGGAIKNNTTVANFGGGIYNVGATVINGGEISGNTASIWGGGILTERGSITLNGGEIKNNFAEQGAGLTVTGGTATLDGATISENQADVYGGGVYLQGYANGGTQFEMKSGSITGNMSAMTGAGIFGYVYNGPVDIEISGGTIKDNVSTDANMGHAIGIYGYEGSVAYPTLELSGSPEIDGDIFYQNDYEDGYVIHVTGAFTPVKAIEINRSNNKDGIPAVEYAAGLTPNLEDFVSGTIFEKLVVEGQNLVWMDASIVYFYDEDGTEFKENRHGVVMGETIDPADVPTPVKEGYTLTGWYEKNAAEPWDFAADTVSKTSTKLYAQWNLNAPDIAVSADVDSPHIGTEAVLTATPSHDLDGVTYTYQWYKDGEPLTGETGNQLTVSESGSYTVKVKASDGAKESAETESAPVEITIEGHVYVPEVTAPTCTEQGYTTYTCAVCGDSYVDDYTPAEGHQAAAEWLSDGTSHWHACTMCGTKLDEAAHSFAWVTDKEATATDAGSKHEECSVCGYKKAAVEIPATGTGTMPDQTKPGDGQGAAATPQTGDNSNMLLWIIVCIAAAGALAGTFAYKKIRAERK